MLAHRRPSYLRRILHMQYVGPELDNPKKRYQQPEEEQNSARNDAFAEFVMDDECGQHLQKKAMLVCRPMLNKPIYVPRRSRRLMNTNNTMKRPCQNHQSVVT